MWIVLLARYRPANPKLHPFPRQAKSNKYTPLPRSGWLSAGKRGEVERTLACSGFSEAHSRHLLPYDQRTHSSKFLLHSCRFSAIIRRAHQRVNQTYPGG